MAKGSKPVALTAAVLAVILLGVGWSFTSRALVTVTFDALPVGTEVTTQFVGSHGIEFAQGPAGQEEVRTVVLAQSGQPGKLLATNSYCGAEFCPSNLIAKFTNPKHQVTIHFGAYQTTCGGTTALFGAADATGKQLAIENPFIPFGTKPGSDQVATLSSTGDIFYVRFSADGCRIGLRSIAFDQGAGGAPDFVLARTDIFAGSAVGLSVGGSREVNAHITRFGGSTGKISVTATGVSGMIGASATPSSVTGSADTDVKVTVTALPGSAGAKGTVKIVATPEVATAGATAHSIDVPVVVVSTYDLRARGMEVTQGTQKVSGANVPSGGTYAQVSSVSLIKSKQTFVRVYADVVGGPAAGLGSVTAALYGSAGGTPLDGGPLYPAEGARTLPTNTAPAFSDFQAQPEAFTFTLPVSWTTAGPITLTTQIFGPGAAPGLNPAPEVAECAGCGTNNTYVLKQVTFQNVAPEAILPVDLVWTRNGTTYSPGKPADVFKAALKAVPFGSQLILYPYIAVVDVSTEANMLDGAGKAIPDGSDPKNNAIFADLQAWAVGSIDLWLSAGGAVMGVIARPSPGAAAPARGLACAAGCGYKSGSTKVKFTAAGAGIAVVDEGRPLTSVGHELGHILGLPHADSTQKLDNATPPAAIPFSPGCGGNDYGGTPKWPDPAGGLEGVALDTTTVPYTLLSGGGPTGPITAFDYMSYCASEGDSWLSPINWQKIVGAFPAAASRVASRRAVIGSQPVLQVSAVDIGGRVDIVSVRHLDGVPTGASSAYTVNVRNGAGSVLATAPMTAVQTHGDPGGDQVNLTAAIPDVAGAALVEIAKAGRAVARKAGSPSTPSVFGVAVRVGSDSTTVTWNAIDRDPGTPQAAVEYSTDGASWRLLYIGPSRGSLTLPNFSFSRSSAAHVRVRVDDGFNAAFADSPVFAAPGAAPMVQIQSPARSRRAVRVRRDEVLFLSGSAFNDQLKRLVGDRLTWFANGRKIATGEAASVIGLPAGATRIDLVAQDITDRAARDSVQVVIVPVAPVVTRLVAPATISPRAHSVRIQIATSVPATLDTGTKKIKVGRTLKGVKLKVTPGTGTLIRSIRLTADGKTTSYTLRIARSRG